MDTKIIDYNLMFKQGETPSLAEVLENREKRVAYTNKLLDKHPNSTVLTLKLNIPGPIKNNEYLEALFNESSNQLEKLFDPDTVIFKQRVKAMTGCEIFYVIELSSVTSKEVAVRFEEIAGGRLADVDVHFLSLGKVKSISRGDLKLPERRCFICDKPAKICAGSREHSVEELQKAFVNIAKAFLK